MENQLNNYNLLKNYLETCLTKNFIQEQNQQLLNAEDIEDVQNSQFIQYESDIYQIIQQKDEFLLKKYSLSEQYKQTNCGKIVFVKQNVNVSNPASKQKIQVQQKNGSLFFGLKQQDIINELYIGEFTFPLLKLHYFEKQSSPGKITFRSEDSKYEIQQIQIHPSIQNLFLILSTEADGQCFQIIHFSSQKLNTLFSIKTKNMILCEAIQFYLDIQSSSIIYFINIFGHLFMINFYQLFQAIQQEDPIIQDYQQNFYQKLLTINHKYFEFTVLSKQIVEDSEGTCLYFVKLPKDDQNYFLYFFQLEDQIVIQLIKFFKNKLTKLFRKFIKPCQTAQVKLQKFQIQEILKFNANQKQINHLYFLVADKIIHICINETFDVDVIDLDDPYQIQGKVQLEILDYYALDFYYYQYLVLKLKLQQNKLQYLMLNYEIFEQKALHQKDQINKKDFEQYQANKNSLKQLRQRISESQYQINEINNSETLINLEGRIYHDANTKMNLIIKQLKDGIKDEELSNLLFNIYKNNCETFKILNSITYTENAKKIELSQYKIIPQIEQFSIQEKQFQKLDSEIKDKIQANEQQFRQQIIQSILKMGKSSD